MRAISAVILLSLSAAPLSADEIFLINGDRLIGEIVSETANEVRIRLAVGEVPIPRNRIAGITRTNPNQPLTEGEPARVFLRDGSMLFGRVLDSAGPRIRLQTQVGALEISRDTIDRILYDDEALNNDDAPSTPRENPNRVPAEDRAASEASEPDDRSDEEIVSEDDVDSDVDNAARERDSRIEEYAQKSFQVRYFTDDNQDIDRFVIMRGNSLITEPTFLSITDNHRDAKQVEDMMRIHAILRWSLFISGPTFMAGGVVMAALISPTDPTAGAILGIGAFALGAIATGVGFFFLPRDNYSDYADIRAFADNYNNNLRQQLDLSRKEVSLISRLRHDGNFSGMRSLSPLIPDSSPFFGFGWRF